MQEETELPAIRRSRDRGVPFGDEAWTIRTALSRCSRRQPRITRMGADNRLPIRAYLRDSRFHRCWLMVLFWWLGNEGRDRAGHDPISRLPE